jgi:TonB family protein
MRTSGLLLAVLALTAATAAAQQELPPSAHEGPMQIKSAPLTPDKDGVYAAGPGIQMPVVLERATAAYPDDAAAGTVDGICVLSLVIGADGVPADIQVLTSHGAAFDAAAIEAVKQTKFSAGTLNDKPVPVRINVRFRFFEDRRPAIPRIMGRFGLSRGPDWRPGGPGAQSRSFDKPPVAIHIANPEFSEEARKAKLQGVVLLSMLVTEEGLPTDIRLEKSLGMGLDEKAMQCASEYRFKPALKDGVPVPARITLEVNFRLY